MKSKLYLALAFPYMARGMEGEFCHRLEVIGSLVQFPVKIPIVRMKIPKHCMSPVSAHGTSFRVQIIGYEHSSSFTLLRGNVEVSVKDGCGNGQCVMARL